jgi:hypothetical protein
MSREIDIKLKATPETSGIIKFEGRLKGLGAAAAKLGEAFGGANSYIGRFIENLGRGSIWEIAALGIGAVWKKVEEWWKASEVAEKEAAKAAKDANSERLKYLEEYSTAIDKLSQKRTATINQNLKALNEELDATKELTKATLELEKAEARKRGDTGRMAEIEREMGATESDRTSAANRAVEAFKKTDEYKDLAAQLEEAQKKAMTFGEKMLNAKNAIQESADAEQNLLDRMSALNLKEEAKIKNKEAQSVEEQKKAEEKRIADVKAAELKAAAEAAKERERLDREAHKKRMDDIRAEIAAATGKGNILKATAANAQNEFDRAFAMYRDPTHAASVINEEKDYRNDLNRLHRDASRYGGKWRIDELSRLMAAGDSQGVSDTLATWRKSKSFSPEIEAMVRASAAERTKTTAEEELRKIQNNTANLDKKLDELLSMKGD